MSAALKDIEGIPPKWVKLKIDELVEAGWRPRVRKIRNTKYLILRLGDQDKSLGKATDETMELFGDIFPHLRSVINKPKSIEDTTPEKILTIPISKPPEIGKSFTPELDTLRWYYFSKIDLEYPGTFGDFINSVVQEYFTEYREMDLGVIIKE
ncbi:MAG: hypothetical protein KKD44_26710 [Proteobacteria bacterium]|nr:hypothetical protein [Pseudomonadota bacterium]